MASRYLRMRPPLVLRTQPLSRARIGLHPSKPAARRTASTTATAGEDAAARTAPTAPTPAAVSTTAARASSRVVETSAVSRLRVVFFATSVGLTLFAGYLYATDTRASVHRWLVPPLIRALFPDAEDAHHYGTQSLKILYRLGLHPRDRTNGGDDLAVSVFPHANEYKHEHTLANPIGISAGLDKDAEIPDALFALGAAVVEVGGCTPRPQAGNPRPRLFRVPGIDGMVNRYGLNSIGADALAARLRARLRAYAAARGLSEADVLSGAAGVPVGSLAPGRLLLVQVAKNKDTDEHDVRAVADDYAYCVRRLAPYADVLVVNVSSPNTPGLRDLQAVEPLTRILTAVVDAARQTTTMTTTRPAAPPRVMVKVSPDEDEDAQIDGICEAVWASGVDGVIVGNTTKRRTGLVPGRLRLTGAEQRALAETGGFSGPAMFERTRALVARYRHRLDEHALRGGSAATADGTAAGPLAPKTLFASGGLTTGDQALQLLNAGASVAMLYTGLIYGGAGTVTRIKEEMREQLSRPLPAP